MKHSKGSLLGATLLVTGTCIGGGMIALPVATGVAGFFPSLVMMLFGWVFMTISALFLVEVNLWMEEGAHVITMASRLLGPLGKASAWILYLFVSYASLIAYTAGGGELLAAGLSSFLGVSVSTTTAVVVFVLVFGTIIYLGNVFVGRVNAILMIGLIVSYLLLITTGAPHIAWRNLVHMRWGNTLIAVPLLLTIFSFQTIVPSLTIYLKRDRKVLRRAILLGTTSALVVYVIWQALVLGSVLVDGEHGLAQALEMGKPATEFLGVAVGNSWLGLMADFFAFFALVTSFLGIAMGLFDFLSDGLKIKEEGKGSILLGLLVGVPTLICALSMEKIFLRALDTSGGIGDALLNLLLPALMLWVGRYWKGYESENRVFGGKPLILVVICYALFVFTIELLGKFNVIVSLGG